MNIPSEKYVVGYGRPAEHSKWKKGQCGNPARIRECEAKPVVAMIDEFFASEHVAVENSIRKRRSALEIILLQLHNKAICGSTRAFNVLTKYHEFAATTRGSESFESVYFCYASRLTQGAFKKFVQGHFDRRGIVTRISFQRSFADQRSNVSRNSIVRQRNPSRRRSRCRRMRSAQRCRSVAGETVVGSELCVMGRALGPEIQLAKSAQGFQKACTTPFRIVVQVIDFSAVEFRNFFGMRVDFKREVVRF
jgi:hypothetical protein